MALTPKASTPSDAADLPEAVALAHLVDVPDRVAVALDHALAHGAAGP